MNLSWGWSRAKLEQNGYPGFIGDIWIGELERVLQKCIAAGLLVILPFGGLPYQTAML